MGTSNAEENDEHSVTSRRSVAGGDVRKLLRDDDTAAAGSGLGTEGETADDPGGDGDMEWVRSGTGEGSDAESTDGTGELSTGQVGGSDPLDDMPAFVKRILSDDELEAIRRGEAERPEWTRA